MKEFEDIPTPEEFEESLRFVGDAKHSEHVRYLFKRVFGTEDGKKCLKLLQDHFQLELPSMLAQDFDDRRAAYMDGQKSIFLQIKQILKGKYNEQDK